MTAPFGIEFYSAIESLEVLQDVGQGKFFVNAPKPHPAFERYLVQGTPRLGVVWIKAISRTFDNDAYGTRVRQAQDDLRSQLEKRYGLGKMTDFLMAGSIWEEPRYWTQSLSANERYYFTIWEKPASNLPDDIKNLFLGASGFGNDETSYALEYASAKSDEAEEEIRGMLSDLL